MAQAEPVAEQAEDTDVLTEDEEEDVEEASIEGEQAGRRRIFTKIADPTVKDLFDRFKDGDLVLQPNFQRYVVWDRTKK
jgi:hypothetical protein